MLRGGGKVPVIRVHVPAGGFHGRVPKNLLERVQRDAGGGHPRCYGVAEFVAGEIGEAEVCDDRVPVGGVPDGRCSEYATVWFQDIGNASLETLETFGHAHGMAEARLIINAVMLEGRT